MLGAVATGGFGREHAARMLQLERTSVFIALTRDGADLNQSSGRIRATREGVSINYRLTDADTSRVRASIRAAAELHLAAGARLVRTAHAEPIEIRSRADLAALDRASTAPNRLGLFSAHVNGTCRLGLSRASSAATPDGQRHGVRGVYIVDGSLLPTAPGVNPQETIMAVSSVISERVLQRHGATAGA
jgi:choline dehydrogenase-like flavoprotein